MTARQHRSQFYRRASWVLACNRCGQTEESGAGMFGCSRCAGDGAIGIIEVQFVNGEPPIPQRRAAHTKGIFHFADCLPVDREREPISLGEGRTPLIRSRVIGPTLGLKNLYFKNEAINPTSSFKDRYVAVAINAAAALGFNKVVVSSTGNLGVSTAAYCAAAGFKCVFLAPDGLSPQYIDEALAYGAHVFLTTWEGRAALLAHMVKHHGWFPLCPFMDSSIQNPFGVEAYKTFAYEILEDLDTPPDAVLFPCARGNGLYGAWKGFLECIKWGWLERSPKMIACQPEGANSIQVSLDRDLVMPISLPPFRSIAISTTEQVAASHTLTAIRQSHGTGVSVTESEIANAVIRLAREGIYAEASSALPIACLEQLVSNGHVSREDVIVCIITATGVKRTTRSIAADRLPIEIEPDPNILDYHMTRLRLDA